MFFDIIMNFLGQLRKNFFRVSKTAIIVRSNKVRETFRNRDKFTIFARFWVNSLFSLIAQKFARIVKTAAYVALEVFEEKNLVWNSANCFKLLRNLSQKLGPLVGKFSSVLSQLSSARPDEIFEGKKIFQMVFIFFASFGVLVTFYRLVAKKLSRCVKTAIYVYKGVIRGKLTLQNCSFETFRTISRQTWTFSGNYWHDFQNCSIPVRAKKTVRANFF